MEIKNNNDLQVKAESTWLNPAIKTKKDLIAWILTMLGAPLVTVELTENQLNCCIANALVIYSKYAYTPEREIVMNLKYYEKGKGLDLTELKVMSVKDVAYQKNNLFGFNGDLFFGPYAFLGQSGGYPFLKTGMNTTFCGTWAIFHNIHEFFELSERMTGSNPDWQYSVETKHLMLFPEPMGNKNSYILLTCNIEPPLEQYYGNEYVRRLCLAEAKILLGTVRKKFSSVQLLGGGTIDTSIGEEGQAEKQAAMDDLIKSESKGQAFFIA